MSNVISFPTDIVQHYFDRGDRDKAMVQAATEAGATVTARLLSFARHPSVSSAADLRRFAARAATV